MPPVKKGIIRMPRRPKPVDEDVTEELEDDAEEVEVVEEEEREEETPPVKKRTRRRKPTPVEEPEEEEEEEEPEEDEEPEEEEEPPTKKRTRRARKPVEDEEDEEPAKKPRKKRSTKVSSSKAVSTNSSGGPRGLEGDFDSDDMEIPGFKLLHAMSPDAEETPDMIGHFVFNKEVNLGKDVDIVLVNVKKEYQEDCEYDKNAPPEIFPSKKAALKEGVSVKPRAVIDMLIPCTEDNEDEMIVEIDGVAYLMCRWFLNGAGYRKFMSPLRTHLNKTSEAVWDRYYNLKATKLSGKGRRQAAILKPTNDETDDELRSAIEALAGTGQ